MIVLDEDRRLRRPEFLVDSRGEALIDFLIRGPVIGAELRPDVDDMAERPEAFIGESAVVRRERRFLEPEPAKRIGGSIGRNQHLVVRVHHTAIGGAGAMRNPHATPLTHERIKGHGHATGGGHHSGGSIGLRHVEIGLAIREDDERARDEGLACARAEQSAAEEQRSEQLMDRNQRHHQHLKVHTPLAELPCHHRSEAERNSGLRDKARPHVLPGVVVNGGSARAQRHARLDQPQPEPRHRERCQAKRAERVEAKRRADGDEEHDQHRWRRALDGALERVALRDRQVLDDQSGRHCRQQWLELLRGPHLAEQRTGSQDDKGHLAADVAQVQRDGRANQDAERDRPADLPCETGEEVFTVSRATQGDARELRRDGEENQGGDVGEHNHGQHGLAEAAACTGFCRHRGGHGRRKADQDDGEEDDHRELGGAGRIRGDWQPRPRQPCHGHGAGHGHGEDRGGEPADVCEPPSESIQVQRQARDESDERRGHPRNDLELGGHRLRDDVSEVGARDEPEEQVAGEPRQVNPSQQFADD